MKKIIVLGAGLVGSTLTSKNSVIHHFMYQLTAKMMLKTSSLIALAAIFNAIFHLGTEKIPIRIGVKSQAVSEDSVEISFSILPDKIKCCKGIECFHQEVNAIVEQKNIGNRDINTTIELMFGLENVGDNHIETYKLNGE